MRVLGCLCVMGCVAMPELSPDHLGAELVDEPVHERFETRVRIRADADAWFGDDAPWARRATTRTTEAAWLHDDGPFAHVVVYTDAYEVAFYVLHDDLSAVITRTVRARDDDGYAMSLWLHPGLAVEVIDEDRDEVLVAMPDLDADAVWVPEDAVGVVYVPEIADEPWDGGHWRLADGAWISLDVGPDIVVPGEIDAVIGPPGTEQAFRDGRLELRGIEPFTVEGFVDPDALYRRGYRCGNLGISLADSHARFREGAELWSPDGQRVGRGHPRALIGTFDWHHSASGELSVTLPFASATLGIDPEDIEPPQSWRWVY